MLGAGRLFRPFECPVRVTDWCSRMVPRLRSFEWLICLKFLFTLRQWRKTLTGILFGVATSETALLGMDSILRSMGLNVTVTLLS